MLGENDDLGNLHIDVPEQRNGSGQGYGHGSPQYALVDPGSRYPWSVPFLNIRWEAEFFWV
jgi:hypothetical protein